MSRLLFITYDMDCPKIQAHINQYYKKIHPEERNPLEDLDVDGTI